MRESTMVALSAQMSKDPFRSQPEMTAPLSRISRSPLRGVSVFRRGPVSAALGKPQAAAVAQPCGGAVAVVDDAGLFDDDATGFADDLAVAVPVAAVPVPVATMRLGVAEVAGLVAEARPERVA